MAVTRLSNKFDFMFKDKEEKRRFLGIMNLYLEDLANEFESEIGSNQVNRLNFDKLGTRVKNSLINYVVGKIWSDKKAIRETLEKGDL